MRPALAIPKFFLKMHHSSHFPLSETKCLDRDKVSRASHLSPLHPSHLKASRPQLSTRQRSPRGSPLRSWGVTPSLTASPSIPRSLCANMTVCVHPWFRHIFHLCLGLCYYTIRRLYLSSPHGHRGPCRGLFSPSSHLSMFASLSPAVHAF